MKISAGHEGEIARRLKSIFEKPIIKRRVIKKHAIKKRVKNKREEGVGVDFLSLRGG